MDLDALYSELTLKPTAKVALVVLDGVGDIATREQDYLTPLEAAVTPNLDALAKDSRAGPHDSRSRPASPRAAAPATWASLATIRWNSRSAAASSRRSGLGLELKAGDVAARANFCTLDAKGMVTDRRAGRIDTKVCEELCALLARRSRKSATPRSSSRPAKAIASW